MEPPPRTNCLTIYVCFFLLTEGGLIYLPSRSVAKHHKVFFDNKYVQGTDGIFYYHLVEFY